MGDLTAPHNELESRLEKRKNELIDQVESDRRLLLSKSLFDLRSIYLAELERNKLPYTELDTKEKFTDMIVFLTRRRLETLWIAATAVRVTSEEQLASWLAKLDEIESDWQEVLLTGA
jgi:hypothetical protein